MSRKNSLAGLALILLLGWGGVAAAQGRPAMVATEVVEIREIAETTTVFGQVVADTESTVAARVSGIVTEVLVRPGDVVARGDVIVRFDTELLEIEMTQAQAEIDVAEAGLRVADVQVDVARRTFERANALRSSATISEGQLEDRQGAFASARAGRDQAQARLLAAEAAARRAAYNLENAVVRAPFDGTVLEVRADAGGFIQNGGAIVDLLATGALEVQSNVPSRYSDALTPGLQVSAKTDTGSDVDLTLRAILPTENASTRTRPVRFVPEETNGFSVGQSVSIALPISPPQDVLTVPKDALIQGAAGWTVFVNAEGKAQPRTVEVGRPLGNRFEVVSGLASGDEVVVRGNERLRPMQDIQVAPAGGGRPDTASN